MAEWLRRLTKDQIGFHCGGSNFAGYETLRSPVFNTSTHQNVRNIAKGVIPWEKRKKSQQLKMQWQTATLGILVSSHVRVVKVSDQKSDASSCASSNLCYNETFRSRVLNTSTHQGVRKSEMKVIPWERGKKSHNSSGWKDQHRYK